MCPTLPGSCHVLVVDPIAPSALDILSARYDVTVRLRPAPHDLPGLLHGQDASV